MGCSKAYFVPVCPPQFWPMIYFFKIHPYPLVTHFPNYQFIYNSTYISTYHSIYNSRCKMHLYSTHVSDNLIYDSTYNSTYDSTYDSTLQVRMHLTQTGNVIYNCTYDSTYDSTYNSTLQVHMHLTNIYLTILLTILHTILIFSTSDNKTHKWIFVGFAVLSTLRHLHMSQQNLGSLWHCYI